MTTYAIHVLGAVPPGPVMNVSVARRVDVPAETVLVANQAHRDGLVALVDRLTALGIALVGLRRGESDELRLHGHLGPALTHALDPQRIRRLPRHTALVVTAPRGTCLLDLVAPLAASGLEIESVTALRDR